MELVFFFARQDAKVNLEEGGKAESVRWSVVT
jgi:hypothetical protein